MRRILFVCVANSARSQMAEGWGHALAPEGHEIFSAGSEPTSVRPEAVTVMGEVGVDITSQTSKGFDDVPLAAIDVVVTLCADEVCPVVKTEGQRLHWPHSDPAAVDDDEQSRLDAFRTVRDQIRAKVASLFD